MNDMQNKNDTALPKRDYAEEFRNRVWFIKDMLSRSTAKGIVYGNSGGKDSALVGILCKAACDDTVGVIMPSADQSFEQNTKDAYALAEAYGIETRYVDITEVKASELRALKNVVELSEVAEAHVAPRLRMTTLYAIAGSEKRIVAGTGNRSERFLGFFTKWGDGAYDFNPISDLTATEIYEFLAFLKAPDFIVNKAPSTVKYDNETVEGGIKYSELDTYLLHGEVSEEALEKIGRMHAKSQHKRDLSRTFS